MILVLHKLVAFLLDQYPKNSSPRRFDLDDHPLAPHSQCHRVGDRAMVGPRRDQAERLYPGRTARCQHDHREEEFFIGHPEAGRKRNAEHLTNRFGAQASETGGVSITKVRAEAGFLFTYQVPPRSEVSESSHDIISLTATMRGCRAILYS